MRLNKLCPIKFRKEALKFNGKSLQIIKIGLGVAFYKRPTAISLLRLNIFKRINVNAELKKKKLYLKSRINRRIVRFCYYLKIELIRSKLLELIVEMMQFLVIVFPVKSILF